jgi:Uma2 family endonuclease
LITPGDDSEWIVHCGEPVSGDALEIPDPIVVFEVLSPGNTMTDLRNRLQGYFRVASIAHYLIVDPDKRIVIHRARGAGDTVATRIASDGALRLDPPGIETTMGELFG